jgi:hypothetical protein
MSGNEILYSNEFYVKFSKFLIFLKRLKSFFIRFFEHNFNVFFEQLSLNGRYVKGNIFNDFQILYTVSTHFEYSTSEIKSMI